jgi:hypothetical protein
VKEGLGRDSKSYQAPPQARVGSRSPTVPFLDEEGTHDNPMLPRLSFCYEREARCEDLLKSFYEI